MGLRILDAGKSKHYAAALSNFKQAKDCYKRAGLPAAWEELVAQVRREHSRRHSFMPGFDEIVTGPRREETFLERAKQRWMLGKI